MTYEIVPVATENLKIEAEENFLIEEVVEEDENLADEYTEIEKLDETEENFFENAETVIHYQCTICSLSIPNIDELVKHMNDCHNDVNSECPLCQKLFTAQGLQRHMRYHEKSNICTKCGHGFAEIWQLKAHLERKISCLGPTIEDLQQDPTYMSKEFACEHCLYRGATKNHLSRHIRNNHFDTPKDIECPDCGKILSKLQFQAHKRTHVKVKCDICHKIFTNSKFFKIHLENHAKPKENLAKIPEKPTEKGFECPECGFLTKERRFLVQHMKVNHAPKDFECEFDECKGKKFTKTQLRLHRRFHTLAFKCEKCGIGFPDNRDLKRHLNGKKCGQERKLRTTGDKDKTTKKVKIEPKNDEILIEEVINPPEIDEISQMTPVEDPPVEIEVHPLVNSAPNDLGIFECDSCNFETDDKDELMEHWNQFHAPRDQPCHEPQCKGKLFSKAQLKVHMKFHQKSEKMGPKLTKDKKSRLKIVMDGDFPAEMAENSWVFSCKECEFVTGKKEIFDQHRKKRHEKQQKVVKTVFQCSECDFETNKEIYLQQHVQMNHES
ncbi:zinc finger protein Xfin-like [Culicoides brevitarsis]|uniref:zinc finger protein Xfin-like n=1 Tax=Culicoides brevitarsis TaxID=469753 RepID=UPI00307C88C5